MDGFFRGGRDLKRDVIVRSKSRAEFASNLGDTVSPRGIASVSGKVRATGTNGLSFAV